MITASAIPDPYIILMLTVISVGFDLRPFLYPSRFPWQFKKIDEIAAVLPDRSISIVMEKAKKQD
jgi:hypothetical protein